MHLSSSLPPNSNSNSNSSSDSSSNNNSRNSNSSRNDGVLNLIATIKRPVDMQFKSIQRNSDDYTDDQLRIYEGEMEAELQKGKRYDSRKKKKKRKKVENQMMVIQQQKQIQQKQ